MADDFFIGWQPKEQLRTHKWITFFVLFLFLIFIILGFSIAHFQKGFSDSVFEFGESTELEGIYHDSPAPMLSIQENGHHQHALLFDFGKFGAHRLIQEYENTNGVKLNGKKIALKGTRIYRNDHHAIELSEGVASILRVNESHAPSMGSKQRIGRVTLVGEIADPKCFLGVMKPGFAKPHRSCAIRCISGGIPPMLRTIGMDKTEMYYLVKGPESTDINTDILDYVADQVRLCGTLVEWNGWNVIELDPEEEITRLKPYWAKEDVVMCYGR